MHYKLVKVTIVLPRFAEVFLDVIIQYHSLPDSIVIKRRLVFTSKFWSSLCYFLDIKQRLSTAFQPQIDSQTERQNSSIEAYLQVFVNFEQNTWTKLFLISEFAYNNAKNVNTNYTLFELNCGYYLYISYKKDINPCSKFKSADNLANKLKELMVMY